MAMNSNNGYRKLYKLPLIKWLYKYHYNSLSPLPVINGYKILFLWGSGPSQVPRVKALPNVGAVNHGADDGSILPGVFQLQNPHLVMSSWFSAR
jgi:hypothetical protein